MNLLQLQKTPVFPLDLVLNTAWTHLRLLHFTHAAKEPVREKGGGKQGKPNHIFILQLFLYSCFTSVTKGIVHLALSIAKTLSSLPECIQ